VMSRVVRGVFMAAPGYRKERRRPVGDDPAAARALKASIILAPAPRTGRGRILAARARSARADGGIGVAGWDTFAEICGGAAAALTGLLFVAVSIRIAYIARSQELRNRAAQTLGMFGTVLIIAVLLAIPGQGYRTLGAELVVLAVISGAGLAVLDRRAEGGKSNQAIAPVLKAIAPNTVISLLLLAAGIVLVLGTRAGLYVLVGPVLIALVGGVTSAWLFLTKITE
jgi:hypothetical protein